MADSMPNDNVAGWAPLEGFLRFKFEMYPKRCLSVACFGNVADPIRIRTKILASDIETALIDCDKVASLYQVQLAACKALISEENGSLVTNNLHSEVLYNISDSVKISEAFKCFGPSASTRSVLVCVFSEDVAVLKKLKCLIEGELSSPENLEQRLKMAGERVNTLSKLYKVSKEELDMFSLEDVILCRVGSKDCMKG